MMTVVEGRVIFESADVDSPGGNRAAWKNTHLTREIHEHLKS